VTGGSSGIGLEISKQLGKCRVKRLLCSTCLRSPAFATKHHGVAAGLHGAKVVITGRRKEVLDAAVSELTALGVTAAGLQGDVRSQDSCQGWVATTVQRFGHLDILVNCAAGNFLANASELSQGGFKTGAMWGLGTSNAVSGSVRAVVSSAMFTAAHGLAFQVTACLLRA